jgi:type IV pilus assembly protein PilB
MSDAKPNDDLARAQEVAARYRCEFVNLQQFALNLDVVSKVPAELMFRYAFVPLEEMQDGRLAIAIADPSQLMSLDDISLLLGKRLIVRVSTPAQINEVLQGIDPNATSTQQPTDEPPPDTPDAPVPAPRKPRPHSRSSAASVVPEDPQ